MEKELAAFVGKEEALVYSTGFTVNEGVVSCLTDRNDYIICDDRDHVSAFLQEKPKRNEGYL